jgi:hypothetical protein
MNLPKKASLLMGDSGYHFGKKYRVNYWEVITKHFLYLHIFIPCSVIKLMRILPTTFIH